MRLRKLVVALIVVATTCFVTGTTIERSSSATHHETAATPTAESGGEAAGHNETGTTEKRTEARILGVDIEAVPFVILAALASLALAAAVWLRPRLRLLLGAAAVGMLAFSALDVREIVHQADENRDGLAAFASVIALLHLSAAAIGALMGRRAQRSA